MKTTPQRPETPSEPWPREFVEALAREIIAREHLSLRELPRCRHEVRMHLAVSPAVRRYSRSGRPSADARAGTA